MSPCHAVGGAQPACALGTGAPCASTSACVGCVVSVLSGVGALLSASAVVGWPARVRPAEGPAMGEDVEVADEAAADGETPDDEGEDGDDEDDDADVSADVPDEVGPPALPLLVAALLAAAALFAELEDEALEAPSIVNSFALHGRMNHCTGIGRVRLVWCVKNM